MINEKITNKFLYLAPKGSYTEIAKDKFINQFGFENPQSIEGTSVVAILKELEETNDENFYAVIPIENSIEGIVRETFDRLTKIGDDRVKILSEAVVEVNHALISKAKSFDAIKTVISHPQGLAQCQDFIRENLPPDVALRTSNSTAQAVKEISELDESFAAISNENAAKLYGMPVLAKCINDEKDNKTRFILAGRKTLPKGNDCKTSIAFSTPNEPGALCKILNILDRYDINMSYIDSRPSRRILGEYTFYIDFDGDIEDGKVNDALAEIKAHTHFFRHLGSFQKAL